MPAILKFGSKGSDVITLQQQLKKLGFKGVKGKELSIDGDFGASTEYAVITFQKQKIWLQMAKVGIRRAVPFWNKTSQNCLKIVIIKSS